MTGLTSALIAGWAMPEPGRGSSGRREECEIRRLHRVFAVGRRRVKQHARHWAAGLALGSGVDALPDTRRTVPTLDGELAHQHVRQRMNEDVAQRRESGVEWLSATHPSPPAVGLEE